MNSRTIARTIFLLATAATLMAGGCSGERQSFARLRGQGSETMLKLVMALAENYMRENRNVAVYVRGGGTANGVKALARGEVEICAASRTLRPAEIKILADACDCVGMSFLVAKDAVALYVNPDNTVENVSIDEARRLFAGEIANWRELGGPDLPVVVVVRPPNSGTHAYVKERVLSGADYAPEAIVESTQENVIDRVADVTGAVGFGGAVENDDVRMLAVEGAKPSDANIREDVYPIVRYLYFYTVNQPRGAVKDFIDWTLGADGQQTAKRAGYVPLWEIAY
jgi:phosphate transport system substrate-binding protein